LHVPVIRSNPNCVPISLANTFFGAKPYCKTFKLLSRQPTCFDFFQQQQLFSHHHTQWHHTQGFNGSNARRRGAKSESQKTLQTLATATVCATSDLIAVR